MTKKKKPTQEKLDFIEMYGYLIIGYFLVCCIMVLYYYFDVPVIMMGVWCFFVPILIAHTWDFEPLEVKE